MGFRKRALVAFPVVPALGAATAVGFLLRAAHRSDLPSFPNQDASGTFGDSRLPRLRVVCIGDSSLTGPGLDRIDNLFIRRIARTYADRHHVELISLAVGGSKATDVIEGQLADAVDLSPDIAVISVGANDAMRGVPVRAYKERLRHILERLGPVSGAIVVVGIGDLGTIPRLPRGLRPFLTHRSTVFDEAASLVAATYPLAAKVHTKGRMSTEFDGGDLRLFAGDQFHASDEGHRIFAEETAPAFAAAYRLWRLRSAPPAGS